MPFTHPHCHPIPTLWIGWDWALKMKRDLEITLTSQESKETRGNATFLYPLVVSNRKVILFTFLCRELFVAYKQTNVFVNKSFPQTMPRTSIHTWPSIVSWPSDVCPLVLKFVVLCCHGNCYGRMLVDTSLVKHSLVLLPAKAGHIMTYNTCPPTTL